MKTKNILTLIVAAGLTSFAANAKAAVIYSDTPINTENWAGRFTTVLGFENLLLIGAYPGFNMMGMEMPGSANLYYGSGSTVAQFVSAQLNDSIGSSTSGLSSFLELNNGNQYVGFSFNNSGTTNYGWLALSVSGAGQTPDFGQFNSNTSVNITSAAYENTGLSIKVGQTTSAVPEPSTYGLIGLGALGVAFAARPRKQKTA